MNGTKFAILAYVIGLGLIWGYALSLWLGHRALSKRELRDICEGETR